MLKKYPRMYCYIQEEFLFLQNHINSIFNQNNKWLFVLKNLSQLKEPPRLLSGKIFETLFQLAEVEELTKEDMKEYRKSILKYQDVRDAVDLARYEGREEGMEKEKISVIQKCLQNNLPIELIVNLTGFSKEQILKLR